MAILAGSIYHVGFSADQAHVEMGKERVHNGKEA